jgi:phosphotransferase system enzyme I (PtsI)
MIIDTGHSHKIWVGMCGEMAGDPILTPVLLGMGLDEISTSPVLLPEIKKIVRSLTYKEAKTIAEYALTLSTGQEVIDFLKTKSADILKSPKARR